MADHSKRTTILLTVVAILFILTIIILCLPYDIGHSKYPVKEKVGSDKENTTTTTTKESTTKRINTTPTTTKAPTTSSTHSTNIVPKRTPTTSTSSSTWSTSSTISPVNTNENTTETTTLGYTPTSSTSSSPWSTSSIISTVNTTENMTGTTTLGYTPTSSNSSPTWSTASIISTANTTENMTDTTTLGHTDSTSTSTWSTSSMISHENTSENTTETTTLVHTDSTGTSPTDNDTQTDLSNPTTEDNVNRITDESTTQENTTTLGHTDSTSSSTGSTSSIISLVNTSENTTETTTLGHTDSTGTSTTDNDTQTDLSNPTTEDNVSSTSTTPTSTPSTSNTPTSTIPASTTPMVTTIGPFINEPACNKTDCKDFSAKMWLQRDTSANPCEDFYQYACGAVVDSQSLNPVDAGEAVKRKIRGKILDNTAGSGQYKVARDFYNSCLKQDPVQAGKQWSDTSAWMDQMIPPTSSCDVDELTSMIAQLINNNFAPLFDVSLGLNDEGQFVTRVTPPIFRSPFSVDIAQQYCLKQYKLGILDEAFIDVERKYEEYLDCTADGIGMDARLYYLDLNLRQLGIQEPLLTETIDFFKKASKIKKYPFTSEDLLQLDEPPMDLSGIKLMSDQINWDKLLSDLFNTSHLDKGTQIQLYWSFYIREINDLLSLQLARPPGSASNVCNILHTLWKESRYMDLVAPQTTLTPYSEDYCIDLTTSLLPELLYSDTEIQNIPDLQKVMESIITIQNFSANNAVIMEENEALYFFNLMQNNNYTFNDSGSQSDVMSEDRYQVKSLLLLKRFRSELYSKLFNNNFLENDTNWLMYKAYENAAFHPEEKYYSAASHMVEEPYYTEEEPAYLRYPGLGAALARSAIRNQKEQDKSRSCVLREEFQRYKSSNVTMVVNLTNIEFARELSQMVWDGYNYGKLLVSKNETDHLGQKDFAPLPLFESTPDQLFYLRSAQIYCEKTSSLDLLAVKERGHIPGPVRVNKILMNELGFKRAFSCPNPQQRMKTEDMCT